MTDAGAAERGGGSEGVNYNDRLDETQGYVERRVRTLVTALVVEIAGGRELEACTAADIAAAVKEGLATAADSTTTGEIEQQVATVCAVEK